MSQLAFDTIPKKACRLTTVGLFDENGGKVYHAECACGWEGPEVESGPRAAGTWMEHDAGLRVGAPESNVNGS